MNPKGLMWACKSEKKRKVAITKVWLLCTGNNPGGGGGGAGKKPPPVSGDIQECSRTQNSDTPEAFSGLLQFAAFYQVGRCSQGLPSATDSSRLSLSISQCFSFWVTATSFPFCLGPTGASFHRQAPVCTEHSAFWGHYTLHMTLCRPLTKCSWK